MSGSNKLTAVEAAAVATRLGIDFKSEVFSLDKFRIGLDVELASAAEGVTDEQLAETGKAVAARLREAPDYYTPVIKKGAKPAAVAAAPAAAAKPAPDSSQSLLGRIKGMLGMS